MPAQWSISCWTICASKPENDFLRGVTLESMLADGAATEKNCDGDVFDDQRGENDKNAGACYASRKNL